MAVHIRLARTGTKKRPLFRVVAADSRKARNGRYLEILGTYDPRSQEKKCTWKSEKVQYWLTQGAQPTQTVAQLLRKEPPAVVSK